MTTAADWLVSAWDQNAQVYVMSPLASVVEGIAAKWLKDLVGLPAVWSVGFVTGAQMANFTALIAARNHVLRQVTWDVERLGLFDAPHIDVIVSDEAHRAMFTALRMLGLGTERLHRVETETTAECVRIISTRSCGADRDLASCVRKLAMSIRAPLIP